MPLGHVDFQYLLYKLVLLYDGLISAMHVKEMNSHMLDRIHHQGLYSE